MAAKPATPLRAAAPVWLGVGELEITEVPFPVELVATTTVVVAGAAVVEEG